MKDKVSISMERSILQEIDRIRGLIPRSAMIAYLLKKQIEEEHRSQPASNGTGYPVTGQ